MALTGPKANIVRGAGISFLGRKVPVRFAGGGRNKEEALMLTDRLGNEAAQRGLLSGLGVRRINVVGIIVLPEGNGNCKQFEGGNIVISREGILSLPVVEWLMILRGGIFKGVMYLPFFEFLKKRFSAPSAIFATSTGAVFGAPYANGMAPRQITSTTIGVLNDILHNKGLQGLYSPDIKGLRYSSGKYKGITTHDKLMQILCNEFGLGGVMFSDTEIPIFISEVSLGEGQGMVSGDPKMRDMFRGKLPGAAYKDPTLRWVNKEDGPIVNFVRNSAAIPVIIKPDESDGKIHVDGGVWDVSILAATRLKGKDGRGIPIFALSEGYSGQRMEGIDNIAEIASAMFDVMMGKGYESYLSSHFLDGKIFRMLNPGLFKLSTLDPLERMSDVMESMKNTLLMAFDPFTGLSGNLMDRFLGRWSAKVRYRLKNLGFEVEKFSDIISMTDKSPLYDALPKGKGWIMERSYNLKWLLGQIYEVWGFYKTIKLIIHGLDLKYGGYVGKKPKENRQDQKA
jgi:hypothetical protein